MVNEIRIGERTNTRASSFHVYHINAFTREPFRGNPAVVCIIDSDMEDLDFQAIAKEMNPISETAFLTHHKENEYNLRWFTPKEEIRLCGHGTLATAHVLFNELGVEQPNIMFHTLSGVLKAVKERRRVRLDFPRDEPTPIEVPHTFLEALGIKAPKDVVYGKDNRYLVVVAEDEETVRNLRPNINQIIEMNLPFEIKGVSVTSKASGGYDIVSRFFAPWLGTDEDPVTGSLHTILAPYWSNKLGKEKLIAYQASERGGEMTLSMNGKRVYITGESVTLVEGLFRR